MISRQELIQDTNQKVISSQAVRYRNNRQRQSQDTNFGQYTAWQGDTGTGGNRVRVQAEVITGRQESKARSGAACIMHRQANIADQAAGTS